MKMNQNDRYNTLRARFGAALIDVVIFLPVFFAHPYFYKSDKPVALISCWITFASLGFTIYCVVSHWLFGQTLGKFIYRIRVLNISEERLPRLLECILRDSVPLFSAVWLCFWANYDLWTKGFGEVTNYSRVSPFLDYLILGWYSIILISMMMNRKSRGIHDFMALTVVVYAPFKTSIERIKEANKLNSSMN